MRALLLTLLVALPITAQVFLPARRIVPQIQEHSLTYSNYVMLYNGQAIADSHYSLGIAFSQDRGDTWQDFPGNPIMTYGSEAWESYANFHPTLAWDGSQWVAFYVGYDETYRQIGRATSTDFYTWTKYATNPVIAIGAGGSFDSYGQSTPFVRYDASEANPWQMWYSGRTNTFDTNTTIGFAYSNDGISWTKHGQVLGLGTVGEFDDEGMASGCVTKIGSTYYLFYSGYHASLYHSGYATFTNPTNSYTKHGVLPGLDGPVEFDGTNYYSNFIRALVNRGDTWQIYSTLFHTNSSGGSGPEFSVYTLNSDITNPGTNFIGPIVQLGTGWNALAAENPCVLPVQTPATNGPAVFDGSNDYMQFTSDGPSGLADGKTFTLSTWLQFGDDGVVELIYNQTTFANFATIQIFRTAANKITLYAQRADASLELLNVSTTTGTITVADGWTHLYACVDMANAANRHIYIDGVDQALTVTTYVDENLALVGSSMAYTVGAQKAGTAKLNAALFELWFDDVYFDDPTKFISGGQPVDLGLEGSTPTGSQPVFYLKYPGNLFRLNSGTGNDFTVTGNLGTTSPP